MVIAELKRLPRVITIVVAVLLMIAGVIFSGSVKVTADDLPVTHVYGILSEDTTWSANHVYIAEGVYIPDGVTLTVNAGAVVKANSNQAIVVQNGGTLQVNGSSSSPASFTSYSDDSLGGDSNGDGSSSGTQGNFTFITSSDGGHVIVSHASFKYASRSMMIVCTNQSSDELVLTDSILYSELEFSSCNGNSANIARNHFNVSQDYPIYASSINVSLVPLTGINQNTFSGSDTRSTLRIEGNSYIPQGDSWTVDMTSGLSAVFLRGGLSVSGSLTVNPDSVVKADNYTGANVFRIESGGSLTANGTSSNPIHITSIADDSLGGDSAGDGISTGSANQYQYAFDVRSGATAQARYIHVNYARVSLGVICSSSVPTQIELTDSELDGSVQISDCRNTNDVSVERNNFSVTQGHAVSMYNSEVQSLVLNGNDKNTFNGTGIHAAIVINNGSIPAGVEWTVGNNTGMSSLVAGISVSGTMNLSPGIVYKAGGSYLVTVEPGGRLNAIGDSSSPIIFTSLEDDSVGGDCGWDGVSTGIPNAGYWSAVRINGGAVKISHAEIRYGSGSINEYNNDWSKGELTVEDTLIQSNLSVGKRSSSNLRLVRNHFQVSNRTPLSANNVDPSSIAFSGADKNIFSGSGREIAPEVTQSHVAAGNSWTIDSSTGIGALQAYSISISGVVTLNEGVAVKAAGFTINDDGKLHLNGSAQSPVTLTSSNDDSVGGDSNGDGPSTGTRDNYVTSIRAEQGSLLNISNARILNSAIAVSSAVPINVKDTTIQNVGTAFDISSNANDGDTNLIDVTVDTANNGLYVGNGSEVKFRGSLHNISNMGVRACLWQQDCAVDVTYTDWGSVDGPFTTGGALVCGKALVTPWKYNGTTHVGIPFNINNCNLSLSPTQEAELKAQSFHIGLIDQQADCSQGIQDACDVTNAMIQCVENQVLSLASTVYPQLGYAVPNISSASQAAEDYVGDLEGAASVYFNSLSENSTVSRTLRLKSTASVFVDIGQAYDGCLN